MDISYYELYSNADDAKYSDNVLAVVISFDSGLDYYNEVVVKWRNPIASIAIHNNLDDFKKISVTGERKLVEIQYKTRDYSRDIIT